MAKRDRLITKRVNIYDGQRVTERDLDTEQLNNNAIVSNLVVDFQGSGVVQNSPFEEVILLDTRNPGSNTSDGSANSSQLDIESGAYDGKGISLDSGPSDTVRGNRIEFDLVNADIKGRVRTKIMILGRAFDGINEQGELITEFIEFAENTKMISQNFYTSIIGVFFNNFSGGTGKTESEASKESLDLITGSGGYMIIREAEPLKVYVATRMSFEIESPNIDMVNFITSSVSRSIENEISLSLGSLNTINDLYIELSGKEKVTFPKDGATSISYGQKFLSRVDNIQKIDLLLSVERDTSLALENQLNYSGDLVVSIHELISEIDCPTDAVPNDLIDFDPEITPIVEVSFGQEDFEALGYELSELPQTVSINFAGTLIADPNISPSLEVNKYYAFVVSRRGDNRTGTIVIEKGFNKVAKKSDDGVPLTVIERFGKQQSKYLEYDPVTKRYVNDSSSTLWHVIHSDSIEVTDGTAYTDQGVAVTIQKTTEFVGSTEISYFAKNITLSTVSEGSNNYVILSQKEEFSDGDVHPRTNNRVFTRIIDAPLVSIVSSSGLDTISSDTTPLVLARIKDNNVRDAQTIIDTFDKPGLVGVDSVMLLDPGNSIIASNLVNRILTPDTDCNCNSRYRIARVDCSTVKVGDLDSDSLLTASDLSRLLDIVGHTINSEVTERAILGGELSVLDFVKSDMNNDGTIDGVDIGLLEDAVDGYINFSIPEEIKVLTLVLENILSSSDNPVIFTDVALTGVTTAGSSTLSLVTLTNNESLGVRLGDLVTIPAPSVDAGNYIITSKIVEADGISLTLTVMNADSSDVIFSGDVGFNPIITSGTKVNLYADNPNLTNVPFVTANYQIDYIEAPFEPHFVSVCDLRRNVGVSFLELDSGTLLDCESLDCLPVEECSPVYKNQTYLPGDLFLPNGNILMAPGIPHPGDFEYTNIRLPLPAGSIDDCSIDLYNNFLKAESGSCNTASGMAAMRYSDGTLVGLDDVGLDTDIAKGRVKFSNAVSSICVDALVDGYSDGYSEISSSEDTVFNVEAISENFLDDSFTSFDTWTANALNDSAITNITNLSGSNQPAIFDLTTSSNSGERFGRLDSPVISQNFSGDFVVDFKAARVIWDDSSLTNGTVSSFATFTITNADTSVSTLKFGWKTVGGNNVVMFYSGVIQNAASVIISTFNFEIDAPDVVGDTIAFRLRRVNDVVSAYYLNPDKLAESTASSFGEYVRLGTNPDVQPGLGDVVMSYEISQENSPTLGVSFFVRLSEVIMLSEYTSNDNVTGLDIGKVFATGITDRATITVPFNLPRRTTVISANLEFVSESTASITDTFNIIPINLLNADNLGRIFNVPLVTNTSFVTSFVPGSIIVGDTISIDITTSFVGLLSQLGHLPGFIKGFLIEPDLVANSSFTISSSISLVVVYQDDSTGIVFKVGVSIDPETGIATFNTRNIMFDALVERNRTILNFGIYLKKSGFKNRDVNLTIEDLSRLGIGVCFDDQILSDEEECFFITGSTAVGTFIEGPFSCSFEFPLA